MRCAKLGFALLVLVLAGCALSLHTLSRCVDRTSAQLAQARTLAQAEQFEAAVGAATAAQESWDRSRVFLGSVLRHSESDDLSYSFARLSNYANSESADEFLAECAELIARLHHIQDMELPRLYNFF